LDHDLDIPRVRDHCPSASSGSSFSHAPPPSSHTRVLQEDITRSSQWTSAVAILLYNVSDAVGKFLEPLPVSSSALVASSAARVLFIPAFIAAVGANGANGAVICLLASLLGVTNGWLTITAFNALQHDVSDQDEYLAGQVAVGALMTGLNLGAASSWLLMLLIRDKG